MSQINDLVCRDKTVCDRVAKTNNYRNALIYAGFIDYIIPLIVFIVGTVTSIISSISVFPISIIIGIGTGVFSFVFGIAVFVANIILIIMLFREIGVAAVIPFLAWGIAVILTISIIGIPLGLVFFLVPWSVVSVVVRYYLMRPPNP